MAVVLAPVGDARPQFFTDQGAVLNGGTLTFYAAGTTTPQNTYTDSTGATANSNPLTLDADGRAPNGIWFTQGLSYKIVAKDSAGVTLWTEDNVDGINDVTATQDEWVASGLTPTYVSATSFTLTGDQTTEFHEGRRLKVTDAGGTKYETITSSVYTTLTTVTVAGDALASPTTAVSYSLVRTTNPSISSEMIYRKGTAVASAATTDIWNTQGDFLHVTGAMTITSFGTAPYAGAEKTLIFDSGLVLTHNATTLQLPGGVSHSVQANDRIMVRADTTVNMIVTSISRAQEDPALLTIAKAGRLTLTTAIPVTSADVVGATTVYFTPISGQFTEMSQATADSAKSPAAVAADSNYDVFLWNDAGTLRATRGPAWSSATSRGTGAGTTELTRVNGVLVNANAITNGPVAQAGIYLGSLRSNSSSQIDDSATLRHVWNNFNRRLRPMLKTDTTDSWAYTTATFRQANAAAANQLSAIQGLAEDAVTIRVFGLYGNTGSAYAAVGIGVDSTSVNSAQLMGGGATATQPMPVHALYSAIPALGRHTYVWLEISQAVGTGTFFGDAGLTYQQCGIQGEVWG